MAAVLHVSQPVTGGVARVVLGLAVAQAAEGFDVTVACPSGSLAERLVGTGVRWRRWNSAREPVHGLRAEMRALRQVVDDVRPDLVHLHSSKAALVGRLTLRGRIPTVIQPHAWSFLAVSGKSRLAAIRWERLATRWTDLFLFCSWSERNEGAAHGIGGPGRIVLNGVELDRFRPASTPEAIVARHDLGLPKEGFVAAVIGRRSEQKGQDVALRAWRKVRRVAPDSLLLLVGDGYLDGFDAENGVVTRAAISDVRPIHAAADLIVSPSRWEGLSLAILEGMAAGSSVVATDVAGSREALLAGSLPPAGAIVAAGDEDELADAILARCQDPSLSQREGIAGRRRAEVIFQETLTASAVVDSYGILLSRRKR
ncbi:glycosyltransferase [Actinoplanes sp. URMC 104]|uniref:glycosyltransferase n=1 Tax=Actinoplanes sp. URMC 104 TaxID=3423409 RepID=UPI003F1BAF04